MPQMVMKSSLLIGFLGKDMTSDVFIEYLRNNCLFAVNNKPATQLSHRDNHQSATFFINRDDPILMQLKQRYILFLIMKIISEGEISK